ncbi:MAG: hypothetical protein PW735_04340 [Acidobacteriaceae bacterium]|nr:hypothetical protein [Acidobacteriaceae bacterium]
MTERVMTVTAKLRGQAEAGNTCEGKCLLMPFHILHKETACTNRCPSCPNAARRFAARCAGQGACPGYGTSEACPPLIVLAVVECAQRALAAAKLPAFGSFAAFAVEAGAGA